MDVLDAMEHEPVDEKKYRPVKDIEITGTTIHANPIADAMVPPPPVPEARAGDGQDLKSNSYGVAASSVPEEASGGGAIPGQSS